MIVSVDQTVALLRQASIAMGISLSPEELRGLVAIPSRESHYNSQASNQVGSDRSFGLWQVNTKGGLWAPLQRALGLSNPNQLFDPYTNAKAVVWEVAQNRKAFGNGLWGWGPYKGKDPLYGVDQSAIANADAALRRSGVAGVGTSYPTSRVDPGGNRVSGGMPNMVDTAIAWAMAQQGKPYKFGSKGPDSFDCSGLTAAFLKQMGIDAPALTWSQAKMGVHVDANNLMPGDLIFVHGSQGNLGHVKIYLGGGMTLEAPRTGDVVKIAPLNTSAIQEARRFVPDSIASSAQQGAGSRNVPGMSNVDTTPFGDQSQNAPSALANATDDEVKAYVKAHYGTLAGFIDDPEIGPILMNAARSGASSQILIGQLQNTNWWRMRDDAEKAWAQKEIDNPGQQQAEIGQRVLEIQQSAGQLGVTMTAEQVQALATESLRSGWSTDQLKGQIISNIDWTGGKGGTMGDLQATAQSMVSLGKHYFQKIDQAQAQKWAVAIQNGTLTEDGVRATLQAAADSRWSFLQGQAPGDYWAPVQGAIADELEQPSSAIDMLDPKWANALERPNADGTLRSATISEARIEARRQPEWVKTDSALHQISVGGDALMKQLTGSSPWS